LIQAIGFNATLPVRHPIIRLLALGVNDEHENAGPGTYCTSRPTVHAAARGGVLSLVLGSKRGVFDAPWAKLGETGPRVGRLAGEKRDGPLRCPLHDAQHAAVQPLRRSLRLDAAVVESLGDAAKGFASLV
jgi:hypothetical protein